MKTKVFVRPLKKEVVVNIGDDKPMIPNEISNKWQNIVNIMAKILNVPAALIMKITEKDMEVFLKSKNDENPYPSDGKDSLLHGLYCETVIGTNDTLQVTDALKDPIWEENPDVKLDMISYLGLPLVWNDGDFFGTICILDSKSNAYSPVYVQLMRAFKELIETDLENILLNKELVELSMIDSLTSIYNRRYFFDFLENCFEECKKSKEPLSLVMIDINRFKEINDTYGHIVGDQILAEFASILKNNTDEDDCAARYGGDEFTVALRNATKKDAEKYIQNIRDHIKNNSLLSKYEISISVGIEETSGEVGDINQLIIRVDNFMYQDKKMRK